ncbi:hypothetical protein D9M72_441500 [compost metagenome]
MASVETPHHRGADDDDQDQVGNEKADERDAKQRRKRIELKRVRRAGKQRREGCERHRISLGIGEPKDQAAPQRTLDGQECPVLARRPRTECRPADPAEIGAAKQPENIEDRGADRARANDGNQRQGRPENVTRQVPAHEQGACLAPLAGADAEQRQKRRSGNEDIGKGGEKGSDQQRLGHGGFPVVLPAFDPEAPIQSRGKLSQLYDDAGDRLPAKVRFLAVARICVATA